MRVINDITALQQAGLTPQQAEQFAGKRVMVISSTQNTTTVARIVGASSVRAELPRGYVQMEPRH